MADKYDHWSDVIQDTFRTLQRAQDRRTEEIQEMIDSLDEDDDLRRDLELETGTFRPAKTA